MEALGQGPDRTNQIERTKARTYQLRIEGYVMIEGSFESVRAAAIAAEFSNVDEAMHTMMLDDHDVAVFGINRNFMYTKKLSSYKATKLHLVQ